MTLASNMYRGVDNSSFSRSGDVVRWCSSSGEMRLDRSKRKRDKEAGKKTVRGGEGCEIVYERSGNRLAAFHLMIRCVESRVK